MLFFYLISILFPNVFIKRRYPIKIDFLIIGAGPCGLGAAKALIENKEANWLLLEKEGYAGGLSASFKDRHGYTWDIGGHVVFSHYKEFDKMLEECIGKDRLLHERSSFIRILGRWVPYPFQNNLKYLPEDKVKHCLEGLRLCTGGNINQDFKTWMDATFGKGIVSLFLYPYNKKVWATDPEDMSARWIAERVSVVDYKRAFGNIEKDTDDIGWGPNNKFIFPRFGGTGKIFQNLADSMPKGKVLYNSTVIKTDLEAKTVTLSNGISIKYNYLINTMPIDRFIKQCNIVPEIFFGSLEHLRHNSIYLIGYGLTAPTKADKCWMYFPEQDVPYYRVTNFGHYSPENTPGGRADIYSAYMTETSYSDTKQENLEDVRISGWEGLKTSGLVDKGIEDHTEFVLNVDYAYPIPVTKRDQALELIQPYLMSKGVYSRGRFGAWLYEVGNMDHSYKMGIECIEYILKNKAEQVWKKRC